MTRSSAKYLVAALVGSGYTWLAVAFWGRYAANHPINDWLLNTFAAQGHRVLYYLSICTHDVLMNVLLAAPFAFAFVALKGLNNWNCVLVAVAAALLVQFWGMEPSSLPRLLRLWSFWAGLPMSVFSLPIAFATIRAIGRQRTSA